MLNKTSTIFEECAMADGQCWHWDTNWNELVSGAKLHCWGSQVLYGEKSEMWLHNEGKY